MRKTFLYLFLLIVVGCTKEKPLSTSLVGKWQVVENLQDPGTGQIVSSRPDVTTQAQIEFKADGQFTVSGNLHHSLHDFDRYQLKADGTLHFYKTASTDSTTAHFTLNNQLLLQYQARCYTAEKFARTH